MTHRATLESSARSSAASPYTFSPRFSFSSSKPPSYRPISIVVGAVCLVGRGFLNDDGCNGLDEVDELDVDVGNGFGAANLVSNFATLELEELDCCLVWPGRDDCGFADSSSAAICFVTDATEAMAAGR